MRNIMVDLETLGTVPGCCILSIGAVSFDHTGVNDHGFYQCVLTESCEEKFLTRSEATVRWWEQQSSEARKVFEDCCDSERSKPLTTVLEEFNAYLLDNGAQPEDICLWGNGADFDNAILQVCYDVCDVKLAWKFYNNRCYRTLKNLIPDEIFTRSGTYHNALDDARSQAEHAARLFQRLMASNLAR